jgi:nucleoside diphosphate kinase
MNEITNYSPDDYHINHTFSVFVTLEGSRLRLQRPKTPVAKRAMHDEVLGAAHFIHQRHFELKRSRVMLQPPGLVKKRLWSKKYPIAICLAETGTKISNKGESSVDAPPPGGNHSDMGFELVLEEKCDSSILFLFARTCREKEEWFRRFVAATQGAPLCNHVLEMRRAIERHRQLTHKRVSSDGASSVTTRQRHNSTDSQSSTTSDQADTKETEVFCFFKIYF